MVTLVTRKQVLVPVAVIALCGALGACGSSPKASDATKATAATSASSTPTTTPATTTTTKIPLTGPSVTKIDASKTVAVGGKTVTVPTDGGKPIVQGVDDGQQIVISSTGFLPERLYSDPGSAIVWTNLTNQPQQILFDAFSVTSPVIPPGGSWSWKTQDSESIAYRSASGLSAVVTVLPPGL
jgi:hypothetical protein